MQQIRGVVTPEAVVLDLRPAGVGSRLLARLIDLLVLMVLLQLLSLALTFVLAAIPELAQILAIVLVAVVLLVYPVASESLLKGRTVGKMALGLRVVTREGGPVGFRHAALRGLIGLVEVFMLLGCVAVLAALATERSQRFGDLAAGTVVVRERDPMRRALAVAFPPPIGLEAYCAGLDVSSVGDEQYGVIRSYLLRVLDLTPGARAALAVRLANPTAVQMRHTPPPHLGPELFLACVASAYQVRHGGLLVPHWGAPSDPVAGWLPPPPGAQAAAPSARPATMPAAAAGGVAVAPAPPAPPAWAAPPAEQRHDHGWPSP